jgi:putative FmdB family regulatory protein
MPIYEYRCDACRRTVTVLTLRVSAPVDAVCDRCGSASLSRLMSRFAIARSDEDRLDALTDEASLGDVDENDPKSMARWMRKMGQELGEDAGDDLDAMVDEIEAGGAGDVEEGGGPADGGDDA